MRSLVAIGLALLSVGAGPFKPDRLPVSDPIARHSPPRIGSLRVCAYEAFSLRLGRCVRDQRKTPLTSSRFVCSAAVTAPRRTTLRLQWTYEGVKLPPFYDLVKPGRHDHWIKFDIGANFPLPGGTYRCEFALGKKRAQATFHSGGPQGDLVTAVVCSDTNVFTYGGFAVCKSDQADTAIQSPNAVICEAIYPKAMGHVGRITLLRGSEQVDDRRFTIDEPMEQHYARFGGSSTPPGLYTCRFWLDDNVVVDRHFETS